MNRRDPVGFCSGKFPNNTTLEYHECMCNFDYLSVRRRTIKGLKLKHCHDAAEMYKMDSFYNYLVGAAVVIVGLVLVVVAFCSCKWYLETKKNPCTCFSFFCCCNGKKKRKKNHGQDSINVFESHNDSGHTWAPVNLPPNRDDDQIDYNSPYIDTQEPYQEPYQEPLQEPYQNPESNLDEMNSSKCMSFCLSEPVQDCCEFFDCDLLWRKKSVYTIPIFGKKKQQHHLQRKPTRPAPMPPPKAVVLPQIKYPEPVIDGDIECEPVPEAPPSPEPIRVVNQKAMYVDPLAFLQRPFMKSNKEPGQEKDEPLYSKLKNMVFSKVKKSSSLASLNRLGLSDDPNGESYDPSPGAFNAKKMKTASLASLHTLGETPIETSYGSKRSLSLASLHMMENNVSNAQLSPRCRDSILSTATDDIPPSARKDEYIDLEEMSRRMEARMKMKEAQEFQIASAHAYAKQAGYPPNVNQPNNSVPHGSHTYTPNFMPASAFANSSVSSFNPNVSTFVETPSSPTNLRPGQYYPPVPASQGRPAVPGRTVTGSPIYSVSPTGGTLNRPRPVVPPRPPNMDPIMQSTNTLPRSPRLVKPSGPPPPPPTSNKGPIESAI